MSDHPLVPFDRPALPDRPEDGHKGTFGKVVLIGGSTGMSGSVSLAATAALRSGSGLVTAAVPRSIQSLVAGCEPSLMTFGLSCEIDGGLHSTAAAEAAQLVVGMNAAGVGPGLGRSSAAAQLVQTLLKQTECPLVLDADALNLMADYQLISSDEPRACCVITPHPGEFARLTSLSIQEIERDRPAAAAEFARRHRVIVALKGHRTVVTNGSQIFRNTTGNSGMATGGSGDVLTGVITSLIGQGLDPMDAAVLGVYVHGIAGDLAASQFSQRGMIASDLLRCLPGAWLQLEKAER